MMKILYICILAFTIISCEQNECMTISDASEIHFWPVGEQSFNLKQEAYTEDRCFHEKFICTGLRRLHVIDENASDDDLSLSIENSEGEQEYLPFTKTPPLSLTPLNEGDETGSGTSWTIDDDPNVSVGVASSKIFRIPILGAKANTDYRFSYDITKSGSLTSSGTLFIRVYNSAMSEYSTFSITYGPGIENYAEEFNFIGTSFVPAYIGIHIENDVSTTSFVVNEVLLLTESDGVTKYNISFSPYDYSLCNKFLTFRIKKVFNASPIVNPGFDTVITPWLQDLTNDTWEMFGASAIQSVGASKRIYQNVALSDTTYTLTYNNARSISFGSCVVTGFTEDKDGNTLSTFVIPVGSSTLSVSGYVGGVQVRKIGFRAGGSFTGTVTFYQFELTGAGSDEELFYSDSVEFVSTWADSESSGRVVIQFKSVQNFAGLIYSDDSPYYSIEIDGQFVEPGFATTEKVLELTDTVINTASTLKEQTNLVINDAPRHIHRKILLALQHAISGTVYVNGVEISLDGSSYTLTKRNQHYNLKPAEIMLTHKNSYIHNVI